MIAEAEEESTEDDLEEVDLSALNEEIQEALDDLDEDDLASEVDETMTSMDDEFSSINENDLKMALGEAIAEEEVVEEETEFDEEIKELESGIEEEEELDFSVGQSEFASLNEEALSEAMGGNDLDEDDHPELDEIDAFVDEVAVEDDSKATNITLNNSSDDGIAVLEKLIATLKDDNVKEALSGMDMTINISFNEKG